METGCRVFSLPYTIKDSDWEEISPENEVSLVFILAMSRRKRKGILISETEDLRAISKMYYPLIYAPYGERTAIIDGLGFSHVELRERDLPDATNLIEKLRESRVASDMFIETLNMGTNLFSKPLKEAKKFRKIGYLIGERELLKDLLNLNNMLKPIEDSSSLEYSSVISSKVLMSDVNRIIGKLSEEEKRLKIEVSMLKYTLQTLESEVNYHMEKLSKESEQILREYKMRIAEMEREVDKRIKRLIKERELDENRVKKLHEKRRERILREIEKIQKEIRKTEDILERGRRRYRGKQESRINLYEEKINDLKKSVNNLYKIEEEIRREEEEKVREIEEKYNILMTREMERLEVLKESRDAEIARVNEISDKIREVYLTLKKQIEQLIEEKKSLIKMVEGLTLPIKLDEPVLVGIPFYIVEYESHGKIRLDLHPPVKVTSPIKALQKIRKDPLSFSLENRLLLLLTPLSETLNKIISKVLSEHIEETKHIAETKNILQLNGFLSILREGLGKLETDGWISAQEKNILLSSIEAL